MRESTERLPDVLTVIGLTETTVTNWSRRGFVAIKGPGRGRRARRLGLSVITQLAVMKRLVDLGLPLSTAATWASFVLKTLEDAPFRTFRVLIQDGGPEVFLFDRMKAPPAPPNPIATMVITIDIRALVDSLKARLAELRAINEEDGPPRRKRAARKREAAEA